MERSKEEEEKEDDKEEENEDQDDEEEQGEPEVPTDFVFEAESVAMEDDMMKVRAYALVRGLGHHCAVLSWQILSRLVWCCGL